MNSPPRTIGPYAVVRELGRGGMGAVYEVRHPSDPRRLAMKVILGGADEEAIRRFGREAETLAKLNHPGVVKVHNLGTAVEGPYLVTALVEGQELKELVDREGPMDPARAARVVRAVADALAAVHGAGVLHRDLKPHNIIIQPDGSPVLLDFGLAVAGDSERLTQTGAVLGTPAYMSPEQAGGEHTRDLTLHADIYSLGATLYHLLAGHPPFHGVAGAMAIITKILTSDPEWPSATVPSVPVDLEAICQKAMSKEIGDRYQSAEELREELDRFLRGEPVHAQPRRKTPVAAIAAGALTLLVGGVGLGVALGSGATDHDPVAPVTSEAQPDPAEARRLEARAALKALEVHYPDNHYSFTLGAEEWLERYEDAGLPERKTVLAKYSALCEQLPLRLVTGDLGHPSKHARKDSHRSAIFWGNDTVVTMTGAAPFRLWDVSDPTQPRLEPREFSHPLEGFVPMARNAAVSIDGRWCWLAFHLTNQNKIDEGEPVNDVNAKLYLLRAKDAEPERLELELPPRSHLYARLLVPTPDGEALLVSTYIRRRDTPRIADFYLHEVPVEGGEPRRTFGPYPSPTIRAAYSKTHLAAVFTRDARSSTGPHIRIWGQPRDPETFATIRFPAEPTGLAFTSDTELWVTAKPRALYVFDAAAPPDVVDPAETLKGDGIEEADGFGGRVYAHAGAALAVRAVPGGRLAVSVAGETNNADQANMSEVRFWDIETRANVHSFTNQVPARWDCGVSPNGRLMVVSVRDFHHELWVLPP